MLLALKTTKEHLEEKKRKLTEQIKLFDEDIQDYRHNLDENIKNGMSLEIVQSAHKKLLRAEHAKACTRYARNTVEDLLKEIQEAEDMEDAVIGPAPYEDKEGS